MKQTATVRFWIIHIDSQYDRSVDVYGDINKAVAALEPLVSNYLDGHEYPSKFGGDPVAALEWLHNNDLLDGDVLSFEERIVTGEIWPVTEEAD